MSGPAMATKRFERSGQPTLVFDEVGDPSAPPVILLHGGGAGTRKGWMDIPQRLARTHRVLVPDLRGHGDSDHADGAYGIEHNADDIAAFIERVAGGRAALVGHSWGGLIAAQVAGTRPELVDRVFFEDAGLHRTEGTRSRGSRPYRSEEFRAKIEELLDRNAPLDELSAAFVQEWMETGGLLRPRRDMLLAHRDRGMSIEEIVDMQVEAPSPTGGKLGDLMGRDTLLEQTTGLLALDPDFFTTKDRLAAYDKERPITCPVFMLRADPAFGPPPMGGVFPAEAEESFLATHPKATVEFVEGAGHGIHGQMPDLFVERLEAFLRGIDG